MDLTRIPKPHQRGLRKKKERLPAQKNIIYIIGNKNNNLTTLYIYYYTLLYIIVFILVTYGLSLTPFSRYPALDHSKSIYYVVSLYILNNNTPE